MPFPRALRLFLRSRFIRVPIVAPLVCTLALATAVGSATAATSWTNGQAATLVLGADNFTTLGGGASESRFGGPTDICADAATGKVFVVAHNQNRILRFSATEATKNGGVAEAVFGQPNFTSSKDLSVNNIDGQHDLTQRNDGGRKLVERQESVFQLFVAHQ